MVAVTSMPFARTTPRTMLLSALARLATPTLAPVPMSSAQTAV